MTDSALIPCEFSGDAFIPRPGFLKRAQEAFGAGEIVVMQVQNERSMRSHRHFFAALHDLWLNLPERLAEMPYARNSEALRKHALCLTGHADVQTVDAGSKAAAERVSALLTAIATTSHGYALTKVSGPVVQVWTPHSQSVRAMGKERFQQSKQDVLDWCEALVRGEAA